MPVVQKSLKNLIITPFLTTLIFFDDFFFVEKLGTRRRRLDTQLMMWMTIFLPLFCYSFSQFFKKSWKLCRVSSRVQVNIFLKKIQGSKAVSKEITTMCLVLSREDFDFFRMGPYPGLEQCGLLCSHEVRL